MSRADRYTFSITHDDRDNVFVGRVAEFASLAAHGDTAEAALAEIRFLVDDVIQDLEEGGEEIPRPQAGKRYSGKFVVRLPKSLHQSLAEAAEREGVSLNQLLVARLAAHG